MVENLLTRNIYKCVKCKNKTVQCRYCTCMARGGDWDDECCAEHDGAIASFEKLDMKLSEISEFESIFERESTNMVRVGKYVGFAAGGAVIAVPAALVAAPALAAAAGASSLLGAASTGTAISSLSGAALTSASLAAVGGGTMAAGTAVLTATGAALGAAAGGIVSNSYFGDIEGFGIHRLKQGSRHAVIVVNGFLSEKEMDTIDWEIALKRHFPRESWYHLDWEASKLRDLGSLAHTSFDKFSKMTTIKKLGARAAKSAGKKLGPLAALAHLADVADNPWHVTMFRAQQTGIMLADAIARTPGWAFTLAGHSLGARVIYYALEALSSRRTVPVRNVYLLGGAIDRRD